VAERVGRYMNTPDGLDSLLVRHHDMVHLRTCARVSQIVVNPWRWAEHRSRDDIASAQANGLRFCRACDPLLYLLKEDR
jgi:hypothetical protein